MLLLASLVLAAAAPVNVVAVHGDATGPALAKLMGTSSAAIDATALHAYLLRPSGMLLMQDFEGFGAAPIPLWPASSAEIWTEGMKHCRTVAGEPPWGPSTMSSAMACSTRLSTYLWQKYVDVQKASRVFELDVTVDDRRGKVEVRGSVWEPNSRDVLTLEEHGPLARRDELMEQVVSALIAKKGKPQARNVVNELASAVVGDPFAGQAVATSPVVFKKSCAALPKSLTFKQKGILTDSLLARWKPPEAAGEPVACTLNFNEHTEAMGVGEGVMTVMTTLMTCSATVVTVEMARNVGQAQNGKLADQISEKLVQALSAKLCK